MVRSGHLERRRKMEASGNVTRLALAESREVQRGDDLPNEAKVDRNVRRHVRFLRRLKFHAFVLYVNTNMLVCSMVFIAWALPRETISGLLGRWKSTERGWKYVFARPASWVVDRIYFWEPDHCVEIYRQESQARKVLYGEPVHWP